GLFLLGSIFLLIPFRQHGLPKVIIGVGAILLLTFGFLFYFQGCFALARAKGYNDGLVLGGIVFGALLCPGLTILIPLILAVFMEDRNNSRWRTERDEHSSTKTR